MQTVNTTRLGLLTLSMLAGLIYSSQTITAEQPPVTPQTETCVVAASRANVRPVKVDRYGPEDSPTVLMFLHGSGGPQSHTDWIRGFTDRGVLVLVPHYLDASSSNSPSDPNYADWAQAVLLTLHREKERLKPEAKFGLLGYSLGASVALALSTQCAVASHVIDWEGSLPDLFYSNRRIMPHLLIIHGEDDRVIPLRNAAQLATLCEREGGSCKMKLFKAEQHVFSSRNVQEAELEILRFLQSE